MDVREARKGFGRASCFLVSAAEEKVILERHTRAYIRKWGSWAPVGDESILINEQRESNINLAPSSLSDVSRKSA